MYKKFINKAQDIIDCFKDIKQEYIEAFPDSFNLPLIGVKKGYEITFKEKKRTTKQNDLYYALIREFANFYNKEQNVNFDVEDIKICFYTWLNNDWIISKNLLNGVKKREIVKSSSDLTTSEMIEHIYKLKEFAYSFGYELKTADDYIIQLEEILGKEK